MSASLESGRPDLLAVMSGEAELRIPVGVAGREIATLEPVTRRTLEDDHLIESMARWRNAAVEGFLTQFEATVDNVRTWLRETVLCDPARLIFFIVTAGRPLGTIGFFNLTSTSVVLDRLILGERGGPPRLMFHCEQALLRWLFSLGLERVEAFVLERNFLALDLQQKIGFHVEEKIPLRRIRTADGTSWIECDAREAEAAKYRLVLTRRVFGAAAGDET